ncbi:MAG: transposase [Acutalibacteraceae bacterium]|nr:transposase [Acutalibacteraceae bacterium]
MWVLKKGVNLENNQFIYISRDGKTTKIHAVVDALGNPVNFILLGDEVHYSKQTIPLLSTLNICDSNILADRACGTNDILNYIDSQRANYTIPPKANTKEPWDCDYYIYKEPHLIECFSIKSKLFVELLLVTINLLPLF